MGSLGGCLKAKCYLILTLGTFALIALSLFSCKQAVLHRPYGDIKVGPVSAFPLGEHFHNELRLYIRHDEKGISAMSTLCPYDLTPLRLVGDEWVSDYSESRYAKDGSLKHGPSIAALPYYKIYLDSGQIGGPKDTLYVAIGEERPSAWYLTIP